ncbi:MAG: hypothetical protein ABR577_08490 [Pyrinomonadaceae bacterium]
MSEFIWETFDGLFKTVNRQERRVNELEARIVELERRLSERAVVTAMPQQQAPSTSTQPITIVNEMPAERAA